VAGSPTVLIIVVSLFSLVFITAAVMLIRRKARKTQGKPMEKRKEAEASLYCTIQTTTDAVYSTIKNPQEAMDGLPQV
ncbi:hypothetical protein cypCar_00005408, partial [Cyprinus carpio]